MNEIKKKIRYYYWFLQSFLSKNVRLLIITFIGSFLFIFLFINFFPVLNTFVFKKKESIGKVGANYTLQTIPNEISNLISNPLISIDGKGNIVPVLASSWEILNKGTTYKIHLKKNLIWSDGKSFVAKDIDFHFNGVKTKIVDDYTIEFDLNHPLSIFPVYLTKPLLRYPLKGVAGLYQTQNFKVVNGVLTSISLSPNKTENAYRKYYFYDTEDKMIFAYKKGEITQFTTSKKSLADNFLSWHNTIISKSINYDQILTLFFNNASPLLGKEMKDVRHALAYATPSFDELGEKATGSIPPTSWAYTPEVKTYVFNPDRAKALIQKNVGTSSAQLNMYTFYDYLDVAEELKKNFENTGLKINLSVLSYIPPSFDMLLTMWSPPQDPDQYYFWHSTQATGNITNYKNVKIDKLLEEGRDNPDLATRKQVYTDFQKTLTDDLPAYFIYYPYIYTIERR